MRLVGRCSRSRDTFERAVCACRSGSSYLSGGAACQLGFIRLVGRASGTVLPKRCRGSGVIQDAIHDPDGELHLTVQVDIRVREVGSIRRLRRPPRRALLESQTVAIRSHAGFTPPRPYRSVRLGCSTFAADPSSRSELRYTPSSSPVTEEMQSSYPFGVELRSHPCES